MNIKVDPDFKEMQSKNKNIDNQNLVNNNTNSFSKKVLNQENEKINLNPISKE